MLSINTNIPSLIAQRSLNNSTKLLNQAIVQMTTGFKINHASDNAANYSITTNMNTKLSSYQVAEDNVAMGLDLLSTAGGSLDLISDKLSRLRALAEQSANGTYGEQSLKAINTEANAIVDEIEQIYSTAEYNGIKLFGTSGGSFIEEVQQRDTSSMTKLSSVKPTQTISSGTYSISTAEELAQLATMTNDGKVTGGEFVLSNNIDLSGYSTSEGWTPIGNSTNSFSGTFDGNGYVVSNLYINRPNKNDQGLFGYTDGAEIKNLGIENFNVTGLTNVGGLVGIAGYSSNISNCFTIGKVTGRVLVGNLIGGSNSDINNCYASGKVTGNSPVGGLVGLSEQSVSNSYYNIETTGQSDTGKGVGITTEELNSLLGKTTVLPVSFQVGIDSGLSSQITLDTAFALNVSSLRGIGLGGNHLSQIDNLLNTVSAKQTDFGAAENRLESALEEISTQYENLTSSRSTLRDADVAEVSSEYIRQQILQQASATLLATANQSPSLALQLL